MNKITFVDEDGHFYSMTKELYIEFINKYPFIEQWLDAVDCSDRNNISELEEDFRCIIEEELNE